MFRSRQLLGSLAASLCLFHTTTTLADQASLSGMVEIDLLFPKNDTVYEPTDMMPFVFAVQNANLAVVLDAQILIGSWNTNRTWGGYKDLSFNGANITGKDIYYVYFYLDGFNTEDSFAINWNPLAKNCSGKVAYESDDATWGAQIISTLKTKKGGQKADFAAAHAANCSNTRSARFNITGTQSQRYSDDAPRGRCGVLSKDAPFPARGNPCAVKLDSAVASSITASLQAEYTKTQCVRIPPTISCPAEKNGAARHGGQSLSSSHTILEALMIAYLVQIVVL